MRFPKSTYNLVSAVGAILALVATLTFVVLFTVIIVTAETNPYTGIVLYMVTPLFLFSGLAMIPIGMWRYHRRLKRGEAEEDYVWPHLDLNRPRHRRAMAWFAILTVALLLLTGVGAYGTYHFTESNAFCGKTCHNVMHPEYIAYEHSSHARVKCVDCHIGSGAGWYAKSKISGAYQVYAVLANKYPKPIPTPIRNLRPAQETCEQCHWPERFFGAQQRQFNHYMYNDSSTHWPINMLIKVGGGDPKTGQTAGIHWHMNIGVDVEYIHRDEQRLDIPWIRITDHTTGRVTVYEDEEDPLTPEEVAAATPRGMDCMDCHNRPSHKYRSPDDQIDLAILTGQISRELPEIKQMAVEAMILDHETETDVNTRIANFITDYYRQEYPELYDSQRLRVAVSDAVVATQDAFHRSIFPDMKVSWAEYPDHIGHFQVPGCMRCHDGNHTSKEGLSLTHDCKACHAIMSQGSGDRAEVSTTPEGLDFVHPEDIGEAWTEMGCYECHSGVQP